VLEQQEAGAKPMELKTGSNWEVYETAGGNFRVNIAGNSFFFMRASGVLITEKDDVPPGDYLDARQYAQVLRGEYGSAAQAWGEVHEAYGHRARFAWDGIENALGDHGSVRPSWKPRTENEKRKS